jgi:hypothetical protein
VPVIIYDFNAISGALREQQLNDSPVAIAQITNRTTRPPTNAGHSRGSKRVIVPRSRWTAILRPTGNL